MPRKASDKADKHKNAGDGRDNAVDLSLFQLVKKAAAKDPVAMAALFERTNRHLYYYAYMLTGDSADAEDLLQEGFIKCILSLDTLQNPDAFYSWMWTVLRNLHTNNVRKNKYQVISQEEPDFEENRMLSAILSEEDTPEMQAEKKELAGILRHMIHALPSEQKEVILLHYYDDLPLAEIAKIQDCPLATVKSRLLYAKKSLRTAIRLEEEKSGVALHATFLIPVYPAILARLASIVTMSVDAVFSVFMNVAAFFGVACSGDTVRLLGTTATEDHPIRDRAYVIRVRVAPIVAAGMALCLAIGFGAGRMFANADAVPAEVTLESETPILELESEQTMETTLEEETDEMTPSAAAGRRLYPDYSLIGTYGFNKFQMEVGQTFALQYICVPYTTTQQQMRIVCPDEDVVKIRGKQIIGVAPGQTRIYCFNPNNRELCSPYSMTVVEAKSDPIPVKGIQFCTDNLNNLLPGDVFSLNYQTVPALTEVTEYTFTSDDPTVAVYDGVLLNALAPGKTTIRALRAADGEELGNISITVYASVEDFPKMPPQSVDFFRGERTVYVGGRTQLICRINPGTAEEDSYFYTVSDPAIISFDGEYVEGLAAGTAFIFVKRTVDNETIGSILFTVVQ